MEKLEKQSIEDILALTPVQEGILFFYLKDPGSDRFYEQLTLSVSGEIDRNRFENAWNTVIRTNEMLRTVFRWEDVEKPVQVILKQHKTTPAYYDFSGEKTGEKKKRLETLKSSEREEPFDLTGVPFRVTLCKVEEKKYEIIVGNHHILYDGWSNGIILKEFFNAYKTLSEGKEPVNPNKTKFKEFIKWIRSQGKNIGEPGEYWEDYLNGFDTRAGHSIKRKRRRKGKEKISTGNIRIDFGRDLKTALDDLTRRHKITFASLLYSAWGILLQQYNSRGDVLFDTTVSGRSAAVGGIENMVGLFINTLPLRVQSHDNETLSTFLTRTHRMLEQWREFEYGFTTGAKEYAMDCRKGDLFDSVIVIENYPLDRVLTRESGPLAVDSFSNVGVTSYDLTVIITLIDDITADFTYNRQLFDERTAAKTAGDFVSILQRMVTNPGQKVSALAISPEEIKEINERLAGNDEKEEIPREITGDHSRPGDPVEEKLAVIWAALFHVDKSRIGIDTDFFDFGGHSLTASLLVNRLHKEFQVKVPLTEIFKRTTIRRLARYIRETGEGKHAFTSPRTVEEKEYYPLSANQHRLYALQQMVPDCIAYNVTAVFSVEGDLVKNGPGSIETAFEELVKRHESLRSSFVQVHGGPVRKVHPSVPFSPGYAGYDETATNDDIIRDFIRPFDLAQAPLLRLRLIKTAGTTHLFLLDMHHIVTDGFSMDILIKELTALYNGDELPLLKHRYGDFSEWQRLRLETGELKRQEEYWLEQFPGEPPVLNLLTDFPRPRVQNFEGDRIHFILDRDLSAGLHELGQTAGATLFMVLLAALNVLFYRYTGQEDIVIGTTTAGREHPDLEDIVGVFIETLAIRNHPTGDNTFEDFLKNVKDRTLAAYENGSYPFRELMKHTADTVDISRNPLFNVMLIVQNVDMAKPAMKGLTFSPYPFHSKVSKVDITLEAVETEEGTLCHIEYCTALFKRESIERLAGHFIDILKGATTHPKRKIAEINIPGKQEKHRILEEFKRSPWPGTGEYPRDKRIDTLFEQQAERNPHNVSVVDENGYVTYKELDEKADLISAILEEL